MSKIEDRINEIIKELTIAEKTEKYFNERKALYDSNLIDNDKLILQVEKELNDVTNLEQMSIKGLFYTALGSKDEQIDKERQEYLIAALKQKEMSKQLELDKYELDLLNQKVSNLGALRAELKNLKKQRESEIINNPNEKLRPALLGFVGQLDKMYKLDVEMVEAINAGNQVLESLNKTISYFGSARNWGNWDMAGGRGWVKNSNIDLAMQKAFEAKNELIKFRKELADLGIEYPGLDLNLGQVNSFMDIIFDNLISDWIVQKRIKNALSSVEAVRDKIVLILQSIDADRRKLRIDYEETQTQKDQLLVGSF